ncbi:MAG: copper chaperone PCu(A)C [Alphaproteobacteria bacterium]
MSRLLLILATLASFASPCLADSVDLSMAWARATPGAAANGVVYLDVVNRGAATAIIDAETLIAKSAGLHTHIIDGDIMRMRPVDAIPLAAGATVTFAPGGLHVMLKGLAQPLVEGDSFVLTLIFEDGTARTVEVAVGSIAAMTAPGHDGH